MPKYQGIDAPWTFVEANPPDEGGDSGTAPTPEPDPAPAPVAPKVAAPPSPPAEAPTAPVDVEALQAQIAALQAEVQAKTTVVEKLRPFERNWKKIAGDLSPERLSALQEAEQRLAESQQQRQALEDQLRDAAAQEYTPQIQQRDAQIAELKARADAAELRYNLSTAFTQNGGIGPHFEGFLELASGNVKPSEKGQLSVYDDLGNMVMVTDPNTKQDRAATPGEFVKMIANGSLEKSGYVLSKLPLLKYTVEAYNKSSGSDLPRQTGNNKTPALGDLSQAELAGLAFKS